MSIKLTPEHVGSCCFLLWRKIKNQKYKTKKNEKRAEMKTRKAKPHSKKKKKKKREINLKVCKLKCHSSKNTLLVSQTV